MVCFESLNMKQSARPVMMHDQSCDVRVWVYGDSSRLAQMNDNMRIIMGITTRC